MIEPLLAAEIPDFALRALKILSIIGAAAVGGFGLGWVASMIAKLYFVQKIPPWPMWFIRTLGCVASGMAAYLILFGGVGSGIGGGGGWLGGPGGGPKEGSAKKDDTSDKEKEKDKDRKKTDKDTKVTPDQSLRVEVLGDAALKRISKSSDFDASRRYRLPPGTELLTLEEVKKQVLARRELEPPLRQVEIVLYNDSPDRKRPQVELLETWAKDLPRAKAPLTVKVSDEERDAP